MGERAVQVEPVVIGRDFARRYLVSKLGLAKPQRAKGARGVRAMLTALRCVQLDPLDPIGNNADLVALARVDGLQRGDVIRHLMPGHAFEHFAKERCLLPASAFPYYRAQAHETPWWRLADRVERLPRGVLEAVLAEVTRHGPVSAADLGEHGSVDPLDWSGWKGTAKASSMALEVLWTRCQIVVCGREGRSKRYDLPERALPQSVQMPTKGFARWALEERVHAAGLLCRTAGPMWSMLSKERMGALPEQLLSEGLLEEVRIENLKRSYLAPAGFRELALQQPDDRMRILGPLDPLLWDRKLVSHVFGFDYVWEVYKPAAKRRFGWYVCPLLHRGELVGRLEAHIADDRLVVTRVWREPKRDFDREALDEALERHRVACDVRSVVRPRGFAR